MARPGISGDGVCQWPLRVPSRFLEAGHEPHVLSRLPLLGHFRIVLNYPRTWLLIDFTVVSLEWMATIAGEGEGAFASVVRVL